MHIVHFRKLFGELSLLPVVGLESVDTDEDLVIRPLVGLEFASSYVAAESCCEAVDLVALLTHEVWCIVGGEKLFSSCTKSLPRRNEFIECIHNIFHTNVPVVTGTS